MFCGEPTPNFTKFHTCPLYDVARIRHINYCLGTEVAHYKQTPGLQSTSELYRPSDRHLSEKLVPILEDRGVTWSAQRIPTDVNFGFLDRSRYCPFK
jgi:hypothetical protein